MASRLRVEELLSFVERLPPAFNKGPRELFALRELFLRLAAEGALPVDATEWKTLAAPLVCNTGHQQEEFYARFQAEFGKTPGSEPPPLPGRSSQSYWYAGAGAFLSLAGAVALNLVWLYTGIPDPPMPAAPAPPPGMLTRRVDSGHAALVQGRVVTAAGQPLGGAQVWTSADLATNGQRMVVTDDDGRFRVRWPGSGRSILVVHPAFEPVLVEHWDGQIVVGRSRAARSMLQPVEEGVLAFPTWLTTSLCAAPLFGCLWLMWWQDRRRARIASFEGYSKHEPLRLQAARAEEELFRGEEVQLLARELRRRYSAELTGIAVGPTVERTVAKAGLLTPVQGARKVEKQFLVLLDSKSPRDQQACLWDCLLRRLATFGVAIERYFFAGDPRAAVARSEDLKWQSLESLAQRYPHHELWILAAGQRFFEPVTGEPAPWLDQLCQWPDRSIIQLSEASIEDQLELREKGFGVAVAGVRGLLAMLQGRKALVENPPYPLVLMNGEFRWLPGTPPVPDNELRSALRQLRAWLGSRGYLVFLGCAVYPQLSWALTLHLTVSLGAEGREDFLARLVQLPWFRHGRMPDWLRRALIRDLLERPTDAGRARGSILEFIGGRTEVSRTGKADFEVVAGKGKVKSPGRDYLFLAFLMGQALSAEDIEPPLWWRRMLYPEGLPLLGLRWEMILVFGLITTAIVIGITGSLRRPIASTIMRPASLPTVMNAPPPNPLASSAVRVGAALVGSPAGSGMAMRIMEASLPFVAPAFTTVTSGPAPGVLVELEGKQAIVEQLSQSNGMIVLTPVHGRLARVFWPRRGRFVEFRPAKLADVHFNSGSSVFDDAAKRALAENRTIIMAVLAEAPQAVFSVEASVDLRSVDPRERLSGYLRASAVMKYLERTGIPGRALQIARVVEAEPAQSCVDEQEDCARHASRVRISVDIGSRPVAGTAKANPVDGLDYTWIPPGTFSFGCGGQEVCRAGDLEATVTAVGRGFRIGATEVSERAYQHVAGSRKGKDPRSELPATNVTWVDALNYCVEIGGRLPAETEWEYASKGGVSSFLEEQPPSILSVVRQGRSNGWGLHNMSGNVMEWTDSPFHNSVRPAGGAGGSARLDLKVVRGGYWGASGTQRSYRRGGFPVQYKSETIGFRCVWDVE